MYGSLRWRTLKVKALDQLMKEVITDEDFKSIDRGVAADSSAVRERLAFVQGGKLDLDTAKEYLEYLLWNTSAVWQAANYSEKSRFNIGYSRMGCQGLKTALEHL